MSFITRSSTYFLPTSQNAGNAKKQNVKKLLYVVTFVYFFMKMQETYKVFIYFFLFIYDKAYV